MKDVKKYVRKPFLFLTLFTQVLLSHAQPAMATTCAPTDQGLDNLSFARYRTRLLQASGRKDVTALKKMVSPRVKIGYGSDNGWDAFVNRWNLRQSPTTSKLWKELDEALTLGGKFTDGGTRFAAPYVYHCDMQDPYQDAVVMGKNVALRQAASLSSEVLQRLTYEVVTVLDVKEPWAKVKLGNTEGYISKAFLRKGIDYRAGFTRNAQGSWQMDFFLAGD